MKTTPHRPAASRRGHTLMEVLISTVIVSIVLGSVVSTMVIAARAVDDGPGRAVSQAGDAANDVTTDLSLARSVTERSDHAITLSVPDRDGDGQAETIRYSWSGTPSDPLMREYNGGAARIVAQDVHKFNMSYLTTTMVPGPGPEGPGAAQTETESDERVLMHHDNASGGSMEAQKIKSSRWCAQYFKPALADDVTKWKITKVQIRAKRYKSPYDGVIAVQIRTADGNLKPTTTVLAETLLNESALGSGFEWVTVDIGPLADLTPGTGYCLVLKYASGANYVGKVEYEKYASDMPADTHWMTTDNSGSWWTNPTSSRDMRFYVHGTVTTGGS